MKIRRDEQSPTRRPLDAGFTLIEIVIAMVIFGAMATAVVGIILQAQSLGVSNRNRVAASNLAARELDLVRQEFAATKTAPVALANAGSVTNPHPLAGGTAGSPLIVDGTAYTVVRSAQWNITGTGASACEGGSLVSYPTLGVTVSVTWPGMGSVQPVVQTAALAPDKTTGIPTTSSFIAAKVVDQDAQPLVGVPVTATGGSSTTGTTDATGCAVIQVDPAADPGTTYSVTVADASYVDISGATNPSKSTGQLKRGSLYAGAGFAVAHGGTITLNLVRADGQPLSSAQVAGSTVSLVAPEFSGSSSVKQFTVTGTTTVLSGLWPTKYGAFFGTTEPAGGYTAYTLDPGGSLTIDVVFEMASAPVANIPAGTSSIVAVPAGTATTCAVGQGVTLPAGSPTATVSLLPGTYDLYATGLGFSCSPGPTAVPLAAGPNDEVAWGSTTLQLSSVPSGGTLWALNRAASGVTANTCPGGAGAGAVNIDGARSGAVALPAGNWWVYQTAGAATGACTSYPDLINPVPVAYNQANTRVWTSTPPTTNLTLKKMTSGRLFVVSTATVTCTASKITTTGQAYSVGTATNSVTSLTQAVPRPSSGTTTYYAYQWNTGSSQSNKCSAVGRFIVGPSSADLSKDADSSVVGP
ncbi:prepilin-type N-terminal cleavage/methylation domain-containing protein [Cellulomonas soli]|uniref:prepilin-type N-terminal cleavage/methylation domain-containing protein n=1 Tax=Cellulomonas soli TaxID=931535 RepID=UPI003F858AAD